MHEQKKKGLFSFILPYIVAGGLIFLFIWLVFGRNTGSANKVSQAKCAEILYEEDVTKVQIRKFDTITNVQGQYKEGTLSKTFTATFDNYEFDHQTYIDINSDGTLDWTIMDIVNNRTKTIDGVVSQYYSAAVCTVVNTKETNVFVQLLPYVVSIGGGLLLFFLLMGRLSSSVNASNNKAMDFNRSRAKREESKYRFTDVAGCEEEKQELIEMVDYLKNPRKYAQFGAKMPHGILLVGNPGTGKTLLAKAVAGEAGVPFYSISGSDFVEMFVGVGAGRVRDMFKKAKQTAPCLVFIDEIDAVGRQRGAGLGGGNDEREQTLNQLLVEMDGFEDNTGVIVMAATNRDDVLDPALLRPGRFDRKITVTLPDIKAREEILLVHSRNKPIDESVNFNNVAKRTSGFSGADLANVVNEAAILAVRYGKEKISIKEIDEGIDRVIAGPAKSSKVFTENDKKQVAYHEAGHAVVGLFCDGAEKVQKITIIPRGTIGGFVLMGNEEERFLTTKKELLARITGLMGGRASEEIHFDDISAGASNDIEKSTYIARAMVVEWGMSSLGPIQYERASGNVFLGRDYTNTQKNFSSEIQSEIDREIRRIIDSCHAEATRILKEHKDDVKLIADTLLEHETITCEEIDYLMKNRRLPGAEVEKPKTRKTRAPKKEVALPEAHGREFSIADEQEKPAAEVMPNDKGEEGKE